MLEFSIEELVNSRNRLAELRIKARLMKNELESAKIIAENDAINGVGGNYGKNAEERDRFIATALLESSNYKDCQSQYQEILDAIELEEANLEILKDLRRERETLQRDRMIESEIRA